MNIAKTLKDMTNVQFMKRKVASMKGRITKLEDNTYKLQHLVKDSVLSLLDATTTYQSNSYPTYQSAVT